MMTPQRRSGPRFTPFRPPFCPNEKCSYHLPGSNGVFRSAGKYFRKSDGRVFPRFRCDRCERRFSSGAFSPTYYLRKPHLFAEVVNLSVNGAGLRQSGRILNVSHATVGRHLARAGRHCLLYHAQLLAKLRLEEEVVVDGFETFEYSQYHPFHLNLAVGAKSWFFYGFTDSPLRRKGTMTAVQKVRREELEEEQGRPDPKAVENGVFQLVSYVASMSAKNCTHDGSSTTTRQRSSTHTPTRTNPLTIRSDEHPAYPRAIQRARRAHPRVNIEHLRTNSKEARTFENPLFPVNLADLLIRHCHAGHRRETIAFPKRRQCAAERLASMTVWRNLIKKRRENGSEQTAAMFLGLADRPMRWRDIFRRRLFPRRVALPPPWESYYWRKVRTLALAENQSTHNLRHAA